MIKDHHFCPRHNPMTLTWWKNHPLNIAISIIIIIIIIIITAKISQMILMILFSVLYTAEIFIVLINDWLLWRTAAQRESCNTWLYKYILNLPLRQQFQNNGKYMAHLWTKTFLKLKEIHLYWLMTKLCEEVVRSRRAVTHASTKPTTNHY